MTKSCCTNKNKKKMNNKLEGLMYGLIPHIGCIGFIIGSILGVTVLMQFFKPLLMNRYFFHILILISIGFATISSALYLRKHKLMSIEGIKSEKKYLSWMYGSTIGINLVLFFFIFPMLANVGSATTSETLIANSNIGTSVINLEVDIPCPGHAPLITNELKSLNGVLGVTYSFPNEFEVVYSSEITKSDILGLNVFKEYPAKVIQDNSNNFVNTNSQEIGECGSSECSNLECTGVGSCGSGCTGSTSCYG